ncbi:hypothetical protein TNCV_2362721 [Trichonephila clavipes]|nr:hypothetical protein TNCV_2362721 [Trichonephila clavipes]
MGVRVAARNTLVNRWFWKVKVHECVQGIAFQASITAEVRMVDLAGYVICALIRPKGVLWNLDRGSE